jgi:hypothetical protein
MLKTAALNARLFMTRLLPLLALLCLPGCAVTPAVAPTPQDLSPLSLQSRRQQLAAAESRPTALKALARIDITTSSGRYPLKVAILFQYPDRFRMESLPLFGPPDFYLTLEKETLKVLLPQEGKYYLGTPSQSVLGSFLPFLSSRFHLADMLALLRGTVPLNQDPDTTLKGFRDGKYDRLQVYRRDRKIQDFWLESEAGTLVRATHWDEEGNLCYTAQFEEHGGFKEAPDFPKKISLTTGEPNPITLTLRYTDLQIVAEIQADLFSLEIPAGMEPIRLNEE